MQQDLATVYRRHSLDKLMDVFRSLQATEASNDDVQVKTVRSSHEDEIHA